MSSPFSTKTKNVVVYLEREEKLMGTFVFLIFIIESESDVTYRSPDAV